MNRLFIDCSFGAAGDMITAALLELMPDREAVLKALNELGLPEVEFKAEARDSYGTAGTHMRVLIHGDEEETHDHHHAHNKEHHTHAHHIHDDAHHTYDYYDHGGKCHVECCAHDHKAHEDISLSCVNEAAIHAHEEGSHDVVSAYVHNTHEDECHINSDAHAHEEGSHVNSHVHHHMTLRDVQHVVGDLHVSENVKQQVYHVYSIIAEAESRAHKCTVEEVHFHEVGAMDAIADVTAACYLMEQLSPKEVVANTMRTGSGTVTCAHGELPVPAPATAYILEKMSWCHGTGKGERCTPTGAALVRHFTDRYLSDEEMSSLLDSCRADGHPAEGCGIGGKDFGEANFLRIVGI